jgi:hypothetical protein
MKSYFALLFVFAHAVPLYVPASADGLLGKMANAKLNPSLQKVESSFLPTGSSFHMSEEEIALQRAAYERIIANNDHIGYKNPLIRLTQQKNQIASLHTIANPGNGDCLYHSVAQSLSAIGNLKLIL